jgi:hypothetical protein
MKMLKKCFYLSMFALALLLGGFVGCAEDDTAEQAGEAVEETIEETEEAAEEAGEAVEETGEEIEEELE